MSSYHTLKEEHKGKLPIRFERELAYMNFVYFLTQHSFHLFDRLDDLTLRTSERNLFTRHSEYCVDRYEKEGG